MDTTWTAENGALRLKRGMEQAQTFLVKGVCYSPTPRAKAVLEDPLGAENAAIWRRDIPLLRQMGANAIRIYGMQPAATAHAFLDEAWNDGASPIYALLSIWIPPCTFANDADTDALADKYRVIAREYGRHSAVMGFSIGGEFNTHKPAPGQVKSDDDLRREMPERYWNNFGKVLNALREHVGGRKIITTALIESYEFVADAALHGILVDAWGLDLYRTSASFAGAWTQYEDCFPTEPPPLLVTEFGAPASIHRVSPENVTTIEELPTGPGEFTMRTLRQYMSDVWATIAAKGCGGFIFEWTDEWWKQDGQDCSGGCNPDSHDASTEAVDFLHRLGYRDEEWFGLHSITPGDPNGLIARPTFDDFRRIWNENWTETLILIVYPAGGSLRYVLFDGTNATASGPIPNASPGPHDTYGVLSLPRGVACMHSFDSQDVGRVVAITPSDGRQWGEPGVPRELSKARGRIGATVVGDAPWMVFQRDDGAIAYSAAGVTPQQTIAGAYATGGVAAAVLHGLLYVLHCGRDNGLYRNTFDGRTWDAPHRDHGTSLRTAPAVAEHQDRLICTFAGRWTDELWYTVIGHSGWEKEQQIRRNEGGGIVAFGTPALVVFGNLLYCFYQSSEGSLRYLTWNGSEWSKDERTIPNVTLTGSTGPAAALCVRRASPPDFTT